MSLAIAARKRTTHKQHRKIKLWRKLLPQCPLFTVPPILWQLKLLPTFLRTQKSTLRRKVLWFQRKSHLERPLRWHWFHPERKRLDKQLDWRMTKKRSFKRFFQNIRFKHLKNWLNVFWPCVFYFNLIHPFYCFIFFGEVYFCSFCSQPEFPSYNIQIKLKPNNN